MRGQVIKDPSDWKHVYFRNTPKVHNLEKRDLEDILRDPAWHKAVFYREPLERFVSAYVSKCTPGHDTDHQHCRDEFGKFDLPIRDVVTQLAWKDRRESGRQQQTNEHFAKQSRFCGGLDGTLEYYDTVEKLDVLTARDKVSQMLRDIQVDPATVPVFDQLFPRNIVAEAKASQRSGAGEFNSGGSHIIGAGNKLRKYLSTPEEVVTLLEHYMEDYLVFGIKVPPWVR